MPNVHALNAAHYRLPNCEEHLWWLPPPFLAPNNRRYRGRFSRLVNYMISSGLIEASLEYEIISIDIHVKPCKKLTPCVYNVRLSLGPDCQKIADGQRAVRDLRMFKQRGVQEITMVAGCSELPVDDSPSDSESLSDDPKPMVIEVVYAPCCQQVSGQL